MQAIPGGTTIGGRAVQKEPSHSPTSMICVKYQVYIGGHKGPGGARRTLYLYTLILGETTTRWSKWHS